MTPTDALLNTIAANHGLELAGKANTPATAGPKGRKRIEEDDALSAQQSSEQADVMVDVGSAQATPGAGPILLAQADTGVPADQAAPAAPTESPAGGAGTGTAGATGTVSDSGSNIKLALGGLALGGIALAAGGGGGGSGGGNGSAPTDSTPPGITAVAISSASGVQNKTLNAGDTVSVTLTLSEATHVTGSPQVALNIGGSTVQAHYALGSGSTALVFSYTIQSGQTDASGISIAADALSLNGGTLKDAAGNNATLTHGAVADNASYLVDTIAPVFTSGATASVAENTATGSTVYNATADADVGVSYTLSGADSALFNINTSSGAVTFKASPDFESPADNGGNNIYDFTVTATDDSGNTTDQAVALSVSDVDEIPPVFTSVSVSLAGQSVIDLGLYGKLIAPVQVEGKWYYVWDMNGDGTHDSSQNTGGQWNSDGATHDVLDGIFTQDISGNANPGADTTDTYRYATLNGVHLALPTANGGMAYPNGIDALQPGTAVADGATTNATYDELLATWDAYNGSGTGMSITGTPSGWQSYLYWSATPSASGHAVVCLIHGHVYDSMGNDSNYMFVALQVLSTNATNIAENVATSSTVYDATADGDVGVSYSLSGADSALFNINASTGAVTFKASPDFENPADAGGNNVYDVTVTATDSAGNTATQAVVLSVNDVDEIPPTFTSGTTASVAENIAADTVVYDATADADVGVGYTLSGADSALFNINTSSGAVTFKVSPDFEAPDDHGGNNVYDFTVTATDGSGNTTDQAVALTVTDVVETPPAAGDVVIDLGLYGKLIAPVQVEGKWYYVWDMNGDGTHDGNQNTGGQWNYDGSVANAGGNGYQYDYATHDVLDGIFTQDISGNANPGVDTTDTYRYATLNGVHLALPTANGGMAYPNGIDVLQPGTAVADGATTNATYDELLAIWDAYNGSGTGTVIDGTPSGWQSSGYWSATPSASGHAGVGLDFGGVYDNSSYGYVALQVL